MFVSLDVIEVQAQMRSCNLRPHCLCALAIRSKTMAVYFDRCTKGFLQVWAKESATDIHIHGIGKNFLKVRYFHVKRFSLTLISRKKHRVEIAEFFSLSDFTWNQLENLEVQKLPFFAILGAVNFVNLVKFSHLRVPKFTKIKIQSL